MNKKTIITKTTVFIFIMIFVIGFKSAFGDENLLIGVTTATAMLMFLESDLTLNPIKNTFLLIGYNLYLGLAAYFAGFNTYLAVIINFVTVFVMMYTLCHNLKKPSYVPFILQYLFMLTKPVATENLPTRLLALIVGAIVIMAVQMIANRNKISKKGDKLLVDICNLLLEKVKCIKEGKVYSEIDDNINSLLVQFKSLVYDKRQDNFYLTAESKIKLNLVVALKKVNKIIEEFETLKEKEIEEDLILVIDNIKICFEDEKNLEILDSLFKELFDKYEENETDNILILKILNTVEVVKESLYRLKSIDKKSYDNVGNEKDIPKDYKRVYVLKNSFRVDSLKFSFAFRFALGIAIGGFIMDFFHLAEGRWILFTICSLSQPQYEISKERSKDRIISTLIGTVIITIIFGLVKSTTARSLLIMLNGYLQGYTKEYKHSIIFVTISAVGSAALLGNTTVLSGERILFVILGMIITMILSRFVFQYKACDANRELLKTYNGSIYEMLKEVRYELEGHGNEDKMKNLYVVTSIAEDKLLTNNSLNNTEVLNKYIEEQRFIIMDMYELYYLIKRNNIRKEDTDNIVKDIKLIATHKDEIKDWDSETLIEHIEEATGVNDKLIISNLIQIIDGIKRIEKIKVFEA